MTEQTGCIMSTEDSYKICVGDTVNGCEQRCERMVSALNAREERKKILREYEALVAEYHKADAELEMNVDAEDEETFNHYWRQAEKANLHMITYRLKHKITSEELKVFHGVKVATSVADAVALLGGK